MTKEERATFEEMFDQLCTALPFVEDAQDDPCLKPGTATKTMKSICATIEKAEAQLKSWTIENA